MTSWNPVAGDHEVLSQGSDRLPRRPRALLVGLALACLAGGFAAGRLLDTAPPPPAAASAATTSYSVGLIESTGSAAYDRPFRVPVHNPTDEAVTVTVRDLVGWSGTVDPGGGTPVPARSWAGVGFVPSPDCAEPPFTVRAVVLDVTTGEGVTTRQELPLWGPDRQLRDHHQIQCASHSELSPAQLAGVWVVDETQGGGEWLEGRFLIYFREDGTFRWDAEGRLFEELPGATGRYRTTGTRLHQRLVTGTTCSPGDTFRWRTTLLPDDRLHLTLERSQGVCGAGPGDVWVLRRLLRDPEAR